MTKLMKKYLLIVIILLLFLTSCKSCNNKSPFLTEEEIKANYNSFDITANFNGLKFRLIKSPNGYYYENTNDEEYLYYNRNTNQSFIVDNEAEDKTLVIGNYDFSDYLNNIYYILTFHISKQAIASYDTKSITFLDREVIEYSREEKNVIEKYYIDKELGGCLYFLIDDGIQRVICQIESMTLSNNLLDKFESYQVLGKANIAEFKDKETVMSNLTTYDITFKIAEKSYRMIKSSQGFYYSSASEENITATLYDANLSQWYTLNLKEKTKTILNDTMTVREEEEILFNMLLLSHLSNVDNNFYKKDAIEILNFDISEYLFSSTAVIEKYYVNLEYGLCLKRVIKIANVESVFEVTSFFFNGDVSEYLDYELDKNQVYQKWPSNHEYLLGIEPLNYGTFFVGYENELGLNIVYRDFKSSYVDTIIKKFKADGFTIDSDESISYDTDYTYNLYKYTATNANGYKITIEFNKGTEELTLIILPI